MTRETDRSNELDEAGRTLLSPQAYSDPDLIDQASRLLRNESPIRMIEHDDYRPVTVITRHKDIREVEGDNQTWGQGGHPFLRTHEETRRTKSGKVRQVRMLIDYDGVEHRAYRSVTQPWFTPRKLARLDNRIADLADCAVAKMEAFGGFCDFAQDIAAPFPLELILSMLGLPAEDHEFMLKLSQQLLNTDPDSISVQRTENEQRDLMKQFGDYFAALTKDRRANPTDDLASVIANAQIDDSQMPMPDAIGYYIILSVAGHETTSAAMAGGVLAFCQNPEQYQILRAGIADEALVANAADEIIRWTTPVKHFCRTAYSSATLDGHDFDEGDRVFLSYPSANRDENVFDDPFRFDISRSNANDNLAFGFGAHSCLGAQLARMEVRALLRAMAPRIVEFERAGIPVFAQEIATGGVTRLPVKYTLTADTVSANEQGKP